ncbi:serine/threonine-protein kinase [Nonomuraea roseola]|uniref:WD40 repeat domain-containing serine/threonine-protein kinase n=1 Tax=Nonomuraea roseola TaxID=46179 RepID=A0ABV5PRF5_9ACTN
MSALAVGDPRQLGEYWLAGRLGQGGQGVVYDAYGPEGERVAIKVLHPGSGAELRRRFAKEAAATRSVAQFCTARVLAVELDGPRPYIVSEYVGGPSLRAAVDSGGPYRPDELYRLATGVATALTAIHEAGVIHRDLKPDNVLIGPDGPRVIDFGIARTSEMSLTPTGQVAGTPAFMAPESVIGQRGGPAVDVWAWGAVTLFAATGRAPFDGENLVALYHQILAVDPDVSVLEEPLRTLVSAAMAKDEAARPAARSILLALLGGREETGELLAEGCRAAEPVGSRAEPAPPPLETVAEQVYQRLSADDRAVVPQIMLRMVMPGEGAEDMLRRMSRQELDDQPQADRVLSGFARAELVVGDEETISLANAALLRAWPRMREWIEADRAGLRVHRQLGEAAARWEAGGRRPADLFQGSALEAALGWAATGRQHVTLNLVENAFLTASAALARVRARRRGQVSAVLAVLLVVALAATGLAVQQRGVAESQRDIAAARQTAARAEQLRAADPVTAMLLSVAAWRLAPVREARAAVHSSLAQRELTVRPPPRVTADAKFALGASLLVVDSGVATLWDGSRRTGRIEEVGTDVRAVALSPDGRTVAVASSGRVRLWDAVTGRPLGEAFGEGATWMEFGARGALLAVVTSVPSGQVWRVPSREKVVEWRREGLERIALSQGLFAPMFRGDRFEVWDLDGRRWKGRGGAVAFDRTGRTLAVSTGGDVLFHDAAGGRGLRRAPLEGAAAQWVGFAGDEVLTYDGDDQVALWDEDGAARFSYRLADASLMPNLRLDGARLSYLLGGGAVAVLDVGERAAPIAREVESARFGPGARVVAAQAGDGLHVGDGLGGMEVVAMDSDALAVSPDGRTLAAGLRDPARVVLLDTATRRITGRLALPGAVSVAGLAFAPGGRTLAVVPWSGGFGQVRLWDGKGPARTLPRVGGDVLAFSPDGRALAVGGRDNALIPLPSGPLVAQPFSPSVDGVSAVAFSEDSRIVATGSFESGIDLWDARTLVRIRHLATGGDDVTALAFSPSEGVLAVGGGSGRVQLWDVDRGVPYGLPYPLHTGAVLAVAFGAGGDELFSIGEDGGVRRHAVDVDLAAAGVCARTGRGLSEEEWRRLIPEAPYREVC